MLWMELDWKVAVQPWAKNNKAYVHNAIPTINYYYHYYCYFYYYCYYYNFFIMLFRGMCYL